MLGSPQSQVGSEFVAKPREIPVITRFKDAG